MQKFFGLLITVAVVSCVLTTSSMSLGDTTVRQACMNQWLFNGVWRVRVTAVEPYMSGNQQTGWQVTEVWRNGSSQELSPRESQLQNQRLELNSGAIAASDSTTGTLSQQSISFNNFPPAGEFTYKQIFVGSNVAPSNKPKGLLITFNNAQLAQDKSKPQFTSSKYNFHYNLGCVATRAAAQAEGGSNQLAATPGCLNQWMSNGIWKMRVTGVAGRLMMSSDPNSIIGWLVTQTWVNISGRGVRPDGLNDKGQEFVPTHVTDEYLATPGGKNGSSGALQLNSKPGNDWSPGASFTFQQPFFWGAFDKADKPIRLLVTFDDKTQNATPGLPHYRKPADFRIDLTCTK